MKKIPFRKANIVATAINEILDEGCLSPTPLLRTMEKNLLTINASQKHSKAHPYHSWERGSNENLNGLIRQYFPKKIDFTQITDKEIQNAETKLNNRPRKRFKYQTPIFVRNQLLFNLKIAFVS